MIEKSGAVAAYIDRKALDHAALFHLLGILDRIVLRLSESEIITRAPFVGHVLCCELAATVSPHARCFIDALSVLAARGGFS